MCLLALQVSKSPHLQVSPSPSLNVNYVFFRSSIIWVVSIISANPPNPCHLCSNCQLVATSTSQPPTFQHPSHGHLRCYTYTLHPLSCLLGLYAYPHVALTLPSRPFAHSDHRVQVLLYSLILEACNEAHCFRWPDSAENRVLFPA